MASTLPRFSDRVKEFLYFFGVQCANYAIVTWNLRALALGWWGSMIVTDFAISILGFTVIKKIANASSKTAMAGYALGGACGSVLAVYITKRVFGQ